MTSLEKADHLSDVVGGAITLADHPDRPGSAPRRDAHCTSVDWQVATSQGGPPLRGAADMQVGMSELFRERNELETASRHLADRAANWVTRAACHRTATGRVSRRLGSARPRATSMARSSCSARLQRLYAGDFSPDVRPVAALRARVWIAKRSLSEAWGWAQGARVSPPRTNSATSAPSSTPRWRGCSWPRERTIASPKAIEQSIGLAGAPASRGGGRRRHGQRDRCPRGAGDRAARRRRSGRRACVVGPGRGAG